MPARKIVIVDDEEDILELVRYNLEKEGYDVIAATNGEDGLRLVEKYSPEMLILDIMMPDMDGIEVCRRLRSSRKTASLPIIMLTAKTDETDVVLGLEMGADDYIAKPFSPRVLLARIKTLFRRLAGNDLSTAEVIRRAGFVIDISGRSVIYNGREIELTFSEFEILKLLISHPGRVFSRLQIMKAAREDEYISTERAIDVQILNLRKKLGAGADSIKTVRGVGYKFHG